jgi:hypothetical protein
LLILSTPVVFASDLNEEISDEDKEKEILKKFTMGAFIGWDKKIATNKFVKKYNKNRKYIYRIISDCKKIGLLDDENVITDFGRLYLEFSSF